jgi:hypothetical protein
MKPALDFPGDQHWLGDWAMRGSLAPAYWLWRLTACMRRAS